MNKILIFLIGLLAIFGMTTYFENNALQSEMASINKTLAHRERIAYRYADRYNFLRYQLSSTNMRVSVLEQNKSTEVIHKWDPVFYKQGKD
uniref:Uncharacterized protein n=1 Tax=viral metagenome TaxID=1070528 RepID=A0A6M3IZM5_9ZZZZ